MSERAGVVVLAALAPVAALAVDPAGLFPFGPSKWLAVSVAVPLGAGLLLRVRAARLVPGPTVALAALVAALAVAATIGEDPLYAWIGTPERHLGVLTWGLVLLAFVAGQALDADRDGATVSAGLVLAGAGIGVVGTVEALGLLPDDLDAGARLGGPFGSPAYLGAAATLLVPPLLTTALDGLRRRPWTARRVGTAVAGVLLCIATIGSGARAAWLGLLCASLAVAFARHRLTTPAVAVAPRPAVPGPQDDQPTSDTPRRRRWGRALVAASIAAGVLVLSPAGARIIDGFDADAPGGAGRLDEWRVATAVLAEHPVLGVGPEGYRVAFADGVDDDYEREHGRDPLPDRAHSAPLDVALAGGMPALAAWIALVALIGRHVRRGLHDDRAWLRGTAAGLVAYFAGQLLLFPLAELEPLAALLAGVVVAATPDVAARSVAWVVPRAATAVMLGLAAVAATVGILDVAADRQAAEAVAAADDGRTADFFDHARRAARLRPDEVRLHLLLAGAALADDHGFRTALAAVEDALDRSPGDPIALRRRAELLVGRARATLLPEHVDTARDELARRLAEDPSNGRLHLLAAIAADLAGDAGAEAVHRDRAQALGVDLGESGT